MRVRPAFVVRLLVAWIALIAFLFAFASLRAAAPSEVVVIELDGAIMSTTPSFSRCPVDMITLVIEGIEKLAQRPC